MHNTNSNTSVPRSIFYVIFTVSGFAGLIYESIWSHYLKLFLGHAAYAQTLVLAIFMGGMAIGAWICAARTERWKNLLLGYAIVELLIGILALGFHAVFTSVIGLAYEAIFPALQAPGAINALKWLIAGLLILPQSILLGMTFPLMTAGIMRRYPQTPGTSLSMLYFTNSLGAAVGVLASGFYLIEKFGMPGTLLTAGLINVILALMVWATEKFKTVHESILDEPRQFLGATQSDDTRVDLTPIAQKSKFLHLLLGVSLVTGAASFCYEIGWIRMLSLVLGSSTHAFEIMLSAFILGLAFGGLWIKGRIDTYQNIVAVLGIVLVAKGVMALATLPVYGNTFDVMKLTLAALTKTESSYGVFNLISHIISLSVMFPAAFCAGMSLPLITFALLKKGLGESSIGKVYAWNTMGAIVGVLFAVHIGMPMFGLKNLIVVAALMDIGVAVALLVIVRKAGGVAVLRWAAAVGTASLAFAVMFVEFDSYKMASGVYRHGRLRAATEGEIVFHKDGKTATVDVVKTGDNLAIVTNGKTDAAMVVKGEAITGDESTMVLLGALPLAHKPDAKKIANIGFGSGMTTHTLLGSPSVVTVDTIEIEPAMIDGARAFGAIVERAYSDPRSRIYIDDAKSFFAGRNEKYDVIVSEPSNPWVSGVSGLFSDEFYSQVKHYIKDDGVLVQWIQLYEIDAELVSSMLRALGNNFSDYVAYEVGIADMVILAVPKGEVPVLTAAPLQMPMVAKQLERLGIRNLRDLSIRRIGGKRHLQHLVSSYGIPANSDYFPIVDLRASKLRFLGSDAFEFIQLAVAAVPTMDMLEGKAFVELADASTKRVAQSHRPIRASAARDVRELLLTGSLASGKELDADVVLRTTYLRDGAINCVDQGKRRPSFKFLFEIAPLLSAQLSAADSAQVWQAFEDSKCFTLLPEMDREWIGLFKAIGKRNSAEMADRVEKLIGMNAAVEMSHKEYLLTAGMTAYLASGNPAAARAFWQRYAKVALGSGKISAPLRILASLVSEKTIVP